MTRGFALITENGTADVWVMDPAVNSVEQTINMPWWALDRVRSVQGVQSAVPLVLGSAEARFPNGRFQLFQVIGLDDATLAGLPVMRNGARPAVLRTPDAAAVDPGGTTGKLETSLRAADQWPHGAPPSYSADAGAGGRRCVAQAGLCGLLGTGLGLGLCGIGGQLAKMAGYPFRLMWFTPLLGVAMVLLVSLVAAALSARPVLKLEPVLVFTGR